MSRAEYAWEAYRMAKQQSRVIRSGFALYGIYDVADGGFDYDRSESDLEHAAGVTELVSAISRWWPELIPLDERWLYLEMARCHDIGETVIGDCPDDGTQDVVIKHANERDIFDLYTENIPFDEQETLRQFFIEFQTQCTRRGQIMYLADKLEAVLQALIYESEHRGGILGGEPTHQPSERDMIFLQESNSPQAVDIWAYHFYSMTEQVEENYPGVITPFIEILAEAVLMVRGVWFDWWK